MERSFYLDLAAAGLRMPIGADLVLHEQPDPERIMHDGPALGRILELTARRYKTPLAFPLMDLRLEKADLLDLLGFPAAEVEAFHFDSPPTDDHLERIRNSRSAPFSPRNQAQIDSIRYIAHETDLLPIGMAIGPFSLTTKLMSDPITAVAMAGKGLTASQDDSVRTAEKCLELAEIAIHRSLSAQAKAGAKAMLLCEPAANRVYISPRQLQNGSGIFERFVIEPNLRLKQLLDESGVDLIFHNCGELTTPMVHQFADRLRPVILSLGSSRKLWEDASVVAKDVVLFGNLPSKNFYSDAALPVERVQQLTRELLSQMKAAGHPFILGSECDVLHVPESAATIHNKVNAMCDSL